MGEPEHSPPVWLSSPRVNDGKNNILTLWKIFTARPPSQLLRNFVLFVPDPQVKSRAIRLYPGCPSSPIPHSHLDHFFKVCAPHFCLFRFVSVDLLLVSVQSKHRNSLFRYRSETIETKVLFRIVPKLVSVPVSVVSNRNYFRRTP